MSTQAKEKQREIEDHSAILKIIEDVPILSELIEKRGEHYKYELDLEVIVYGRTYEGGKVGPYARLWVYESGAEVICAGQWAASSFYVLIDGDLVVKREDQEGIERVMKHEDIFGEMAIVEGDQRSRTVVVPEGSTAKVLELQRPALRLLRKLPNFARAFDEQYRQHSLDVTLGTLREASSGAFDDDLLEMLKNIARFRVYGRPHVLLREGQPITNIYFINKGWVEVVCDVPSGLSEIEVVEGQTDQSNKRFLGAGNCFGLEVFDKGDAEWQYAVVIQARTELLEIPVERLHAHPELRKILKEQFSNFSEVDEEKILEPVLDKRAAAAVQKEITTGIVDGTNLLVMDMDLCIRCGNCSLACHKVHGQSRLLRRGIHIERPVKLQSEKIQHVLAPSVCLHCQDPECLTGCPTGAIGRFAGGQIDINSKTCIGCGDCATQCPYNAISMIPAEPPRPSGWFGRAKDFLRITPQEIPPSVQRDDDLLAVKCNLCAGTGLNPSSKTTQAYSCQENCPTGALLRVNPRDYFSETKNVIGTIYRDQTHAISRNIHIEDKVAKHWHRGGVLAVIIFALAALWAAGRYGLDEPLGRTLVSVRWITGIAGGVGILGEMLYLARKQVYKKRRGPLRYWLLAHIYLGALTCIVLLVHGGWHSGGLLTSLLMISFDLAILSGLVGILCYRYVPRLLTDIEGDPLLLDDLLVRRKELREDLESIDISDEKLKEVIEKKVRKRLLSLGYLFNQCLHPVELSRLLADARAEFKVEADRLKLSSSSRRTLIEAVETMATLRRVESLIFLHRLLKLWLAPHVVSTSIMLVLMVGHIVQVFSLAGR